MSEPDITALALAGGRGDEAAITAFIRATQRDVMRFGADLLAGRKPGGSVRPSSTPARRATPPAVAKPPAARAAPRRRSRPSLARVS